MTKMRKKTSKLTIILILVVTITLGAVSYLYYREFTKSEGDELRLLYLEGVMQDSLKQNNIFDTVVTVDHEFEKLKNGEHYFLITFVNFPDTAFATFRVTNENGDTVSNPKTQSIDSNKPTKVHFIVKSSDKEYNLQYENPNGPELDLVRIELSL